MESGYPCAERWMDREGWSRSRCSPIFAGPCDLVLLSTSCAAETCSAICTSFNLDRTRRSSIQGMIRESARSGHSGPGKPGYVSLAGRPLADQNLQRTGFVSPPREEPGGLDSPGYSDACFRTAGLIGYATGRPAKKSSTCSAMSVDTCACGSRVEAGMWGVRRTLA